MRIMAETSSKNSTVRMVLERNGFTHETTLRKHTFSAGSWRDIALYSLLHEDWTTSTRR